jgi:hypothetical protein
MHRTAHFYIEVVTKLATNKQVLGIRPAHERRNPAWMERHYSVKELAEIKGLVAGSTSILFQKYQQISKRYKQSSSHPTVGRNCT